MEVRELTEDELLCRYSFEENGIDSNASWALHGGGGCLYETYGPELDYVTSLVDQRRVWTLISADRKDGVYLVNGFRSVDRMGYFISTEPYNSIEGSIQAFISTKLD